MNGFFVLVGNFEFVVRNRGRCVLFGFGFW